MLQLTVYDILKRETFSIPLLKCLENRRPPANQCGIHSLAINPSRSILATGAENTKDIAFYKLPTFDPLAIGEVIIPIFSFLRSYGILSFSFSKAHAYLYT